MDRTQGQPEQRDRQQGPAAGRPANPSVKQSVNPSASQSSEVPAQPPARIVTLTAGAFSLTVNPVDGSEIEPLRPGTTPALPAKRDALDRADHDAAARPPVLPGPPAPDRPLLERAEERERLVRLLARGRSVRLTGPAGSGRSALLDSVAAACAELAPDGVVRLSGYGRKQPAELLYALYATVYDARGERPDRTELLARIARIGAIVLLDDLELGGTALDELLRATPECAYLLAATPETKAPSDDAHLEEVFLGGLGRADCVRLLEAGTGRALTEEETAWAEDLRFASEGLPLRFVQAAGLLRQRDELNRSSAEDDDEEPGVFEERPRDAGPVPLPTLAEAAAPAELLAERVSESSRAALRIACALGGELPHHAHLPAMVGDTHADAAVGELLACGLITPVGSRYRLAEGVARQLEEAGFVESAAEEARTAARHYAWWTGHASVTPARVAEQADAVLAALAGADVVAAVLLARTAAPAFAASMHWEAWERVLRAGAEAARKAGEVAEQAYFHHELGVLALCEGRLDRARAELEASIGLRGALADRRGTVAGRRALALVTDREAMGVEATPPLRLAPPVAPVGPVAPPVVVAPPVAPPVAVVEPAAREAVTQVTPVVRRMESPLTTTPTTPTTTLAGVFDEAFPPVAMPKFEPVPVPGPVPGPASEPRRRTVVLAAAGALTVVALGTVVALALTSGDAQPPQRPGVSSTPASVVSPVAPEAPVVPAPGTSGNDPAPEPGTSAPPAGSADPQPGLSRAPGNTAPTARTTPPRRTQSPAAPPATKPAPPSPTTPTPEPPDPPAPSASASESAPSTQSATATAPDQSPPPPL
ncbi:ATP-binding protein [Streptomyces sp. NPDC003042]